MPERLAAEHRGSHDGEDGTSVGTAVVSSVAAVAGVEPTALPPLHWSLDTDALDSIVGAGRGDGVTVTFTYAGYRVSVDGEGSIRIREAA